MSGRGISKLGLPPRQYRVDIHFPDFETLESCHREDHLRAKMLHKMAEYWHRVAPQGGALSQQLPNDRGVQRRGTDNRDIEEVRKLASGLLRAASGGDVPETLSSSTYMRGLRINVAGAIWEMIEKCGADNVASFTIVPATWENDIENLKSISPADMIERLRSALSTAGSSGAKGWIIGFLHGEYEPIQGVCRPHIHGFACGDMIRVIDRLRMFPNYHTSLWLDGDTLNPVYRRIKITRKPLTDLPRAVSYPLQSFWPQRALLISPDGRRIRARRKGRIEEPWHSDLIRWLNWWYPEALALMIGLRVTKDGLKQTKPVS
ncbi:hypothetical protein [Novosphingobium sp. Chol11]|uniref:hypothetical protein n=1 Tax=Novosphingobium sp. Chol11 TaxID=1385763 RepID=UPI0025F3673C|nr:hypothetical protein [Novosphingobium sp. Chol11]